jgi:hypothetical protein
MALCCLFLFFFFNLNFSTFFGLDTQKQVGPGDPKDHWAKSNFIQSYDEETHVHKNNHGKNKTSTPFQGFYQMRSPPTQIHFFPLESTF